MGGSFGELNKGTKGREGGEKGGGRRSVFNIGYDIYRVFIIKNL